MTWNSEIFQYDSSILAGWLSWVFQVAKDESFCVIFSIKVAWHDPYCIRKQYALFDRLGIYQKFKTQKHQLHTINNQRTIRKQGLKRNLNKHPNEPKDKGN